MATNLPSCFSIEFLEQLLKFLVNFTLLKYVKSQRSYGFLITKDLIFGFQILDLKDHFSASLTLSHLGDLIHSQPGGGDSTPLRNFVSVNPNETKFGVVIIPLKKKVNRDFISILPLRHFDVRMTSYKNFIVDLGFRTQKYPLYRI